MDVSSYRLTKEKVKALRNRPTMFGNYEYSLTSQQQTDAQMFLRSLPAKLQNSKTWKMLYNLTYATSWTVEPKHQVGTAQEKEE